jgi:hypothetical protein
MDKQDLHHLERTILDLKELFAKMADNSDMDELLKVIHRPGWTTPAEHMLVGSVVESLHAQLQNAITLRKALLRGSSQVGGQQATAA